MNNPLRILIAVAGYKPATVYGGPTYCVSALAEELTRKGYRVTVLTTNANGKNDFAYKSGITKWIDGVKVVYYRRITGDPTSVSPAHTRALIKQIRDADLVHINGWWNWVAIMTLLVCKLYHIPHVLSPHGSLSEYTFRTTNTMHLKKWMHHLFFKPLLSRTILHVTSDEEARKFKGVVSQAKVITIPNLINISQQDPIHHSFEGTLRLVFLGRIDKVKNLELIIEALKHVSFPYTFSIAGEGDPAYVTQLQKLIGDHQQIRMIGPVYDFAKFDFLAKADVLVLLSHTENFGNVVIEALSQGTAVLLSTHVGSADFVTEYDLGWIIEPDQKICVETLHVINAGRERLNEIRHRAPQIIQSQFNPSALADSYISECYSQVNPKFALLKESSQVG